MKSVLLTDKQGNDLGSAEIVAAHTNGGQLHKAFSVLIFSPDRNMILLQRRAQQKMLWPRYWSNTCCSHPKGTLPIEIEAANRLQEECGFSTQLTVAGSFIYRADDPEGRGTEHEYDTVLTGITEQSTKINADPEEIEEWKWVDLETLQKDLEEHPDLYTPWLSKALSIAMSNEQ